MEAPSDHRAVGSRAEREQRRPARGAQALGIPAATIRRNVKGCWNLGYCGMGCPTNAKQSMLVTTIPAALDRGATLLTRARAWTFDHSGGRVDSPRLRRHGRARHRPGRSPHRRARPDLRRCRRRDRHAGAAAAKRRARPRSHRRQAHVPASDRRLRRADAAIASTATPARRRPSTRTTSSTRCRVDGPIGFKLEAPPLHPVLTAITLPGDGAAHARWMRELPHMQVADRAAARRLSSGQPRRHGCAARRRHAVARLSARRLTSGTARGARSRRWPRSSSPPARRRSCRSTRRARATRTGAEARAAIAAFASAPLATPVVSAHVMGGCPLGPDPRRAVVDTDGRHHHLRQSVRVRRFAVPDVASAPIRSFRSTGSSRRLASALAQRLAPTRTARTRLG